MGVGGNESREVADVEAEGGPAVVRLSRFSKGAAGSNINRSCDGTLKNP